MLVKEISRKFRYLIFVTALYILFYVCGKYKLNCLILFINLEIINKERDLRLQNELL